MNLQGQDNAVSGTIHAIYCFRAIDRLSPARFESRPRDRASFEHVCSGIGIPHIYRYLRDIEKLPEDAETTRIVNSAADPSVHIISKALDAEHLSKLCAATVDYFSSILAAEAAILPSNSSPLAESTLRAESQRTRCRSSRSRRSCSVSNARGALRNSSHVFPSTEL